MSDKRFKDLDPVDQEIRKHLHPVAWAGTYTLLEIRMISGFELFNTRPYHNYENWSTGYNVSDGVIQAAAEDLDDAVRAFFVAKADPKPWNLVRPNSWPLTVARFHQVCVAEDQREIGVHLKCTEEATDD
jgi:hypothetical protein